MGQTAAGARHGARRVVNTFPTGWRLDQHLARQHDLRDRRRELPLRPPARERSRCHHDETVESMAAASDAPDPATSPWPTLVTADPMPSRAPGRAVIARRMRL